MYLYKAEDKQHEKFGGYIVCERNDALVSHTNYTRKRSWGGGGKGRGEGNDRVSYSRQQTNFASPPFFLSYTEQLLLV